MGCVTMTYHPTLKKYLMCVTDGGTTIGKFNTYLLESDHIAGPWKLVTYMKHFGEQAYFVNIPIEVPRRRRPNVVALLCGQFHGLERRVVPFPPAGSRYGMCLQEVRLLGPGRPAERR